VGSVHDRHQGVLTTPVGADCCCCPNSCPPQKIDRMSNHSIDSLSWIIEPPPLDRLSLCLKPLPHRHLTSMPLPLHSPSISDKGKDQKCYISIGVSHGAAGAPALRFLDCRPAIYYVDVRCSELLINCSGIGGSSERSEDLIALSKLVNAVDCGQEHASLIHEHIFQYFVKSIVHRSGRKDDSCFIGYRTRARHPTLGHLQLDQSVNQCFDVDPSASDWGTGQLVLPLIMFSFDLSMKSHNHIFPFLLGVHFRTKTAQTAQIHEKTFRTLK
jgi:hypothetical protein